MADSIATQWGDSGFLGDRFLSLQYALFITSFIAVLGGAFFLASAVFIVQDKKNTDLVVKGAGGFNFRGSCFPHLDIDR